MDANGRRGPFTLADLLVQPMDPDALISRNGQEPWIPARQLSELRQMRDSAGSPPRVVPRERRSMTWSGYVTNAILAANVLVFVAMVLSGVDWMNPDEGRMLAWGADYWPLVTSGQGWRLLTAAFLHFGVIHLAANMYALMSLGWLVERLLGRWFYAVMYLLSAVVSSAVAVWWNPESVSAGASGAVFAVYGALIGYLLIHRATFPRSATLTLMQGLLIFVGVNVAFGLTHAGISNAAHIGGLVCGIVLGALFGRPIEPEARARQTRWRAAVAAGVSVAVAAGLVFGIPRGNFDAKSEARFVAERRQVFVDERRAADAYKELVERAKAGKLSDEKLAAGLEERVIPIWDGIEKRLSGLSISARSPSRPLYAAMMEYYGNRAAAYRALAAGLRTGNEETLKRFEELERRAVAARERLNGVVGD
jgi:rhomboid protease GluP